MTDPPAHRDVRQSRDRVPVGWVLTLTAAAVGIILLGILWVEWRLAPVQARVQRAGPAPGQVPEGPREISRVDQTLVRVDGIAARLAAEKEAHLGSWGWVDRERGLVHLPIDRAMDLVAGEEK